MAYLSVPKISRHLIFLHLSSPFIVDNCSYISILSFAITYCHYLTYIYYNKFFRQSIGKLSYFTAYLILNSKKSLWKTL